MQKAIFVFDAKNAITEVDTGKASGVTSFAEKRHALSYGIAHCDRAVRRTGVSRSFFYFVATAISFARSHSNGSNRGAD